MLTRTVCTIAASFLFAFAGDAIPSGTLYSNLGVTTQTNISVSASGPLFDSFSTGPAAVNLADVKLDLVIAGPILYHRPREAPVLLRAAYWAPMPVARSKASRSGRHPRDGGGSITVALYADSATSPGALLTTIGTLSDDSLTMTLTNYDFPLASPFPLSTNQRYWIGISTVNSSIAGWAVAQNNTGIGVGSEFWYASGTVHPNTDPPFQMLVIGTPQTIPATPAPSALILVLVGIASGALYWNRNKLAVQR